MPAEALLRELGSLHGCGVVRLGAETATVKVLLPAVRALVTNGRCPELLWERMEDGVWRSCSYHDLTAAQQGAVREYVASGGLSADPRVAGVSLHVGGRLEVRWKPGRSPEECRPTLDEELRAYVAFARAAR